MINVVTILFEGITAWICLHLVFGKKHEKGIKMIMFLMLYVLFFTLCSYSFIPKEGYILFLIVIVFICKKMFKESLLNTLIKFIVSLVLLGVFEAGIMFFMYPIWNDIENMELKCMMAAFLMVWFSKTFSLIFFRKKYNISNIYIGKNMLLFALFIMSIWFYVKFVFEQQRKPDIVYVILYAIIMFTFVCIIKIQKTTFELEKKNLVIELNGLYGDAYRELIDVVRRRQHDYKNQLIAIAGMNCFKDEKNKSNDIQEKYISILNSESQFDGILTSCENSILAGYLYNICNKFYDDGFIVKHNIKFVDISDTIKIKDIIEIIGILLTNAKENVVDKDKVIHIFIDGKKDKCKIEVENCSEYKDFNTTEKMFQYGYSTKGNDRGLGLYSLKKITNKYDGDIVVCNKNVNGETSIVFSVVI